MFIIGAEHSLTSFFVLVGEEMNIDDVKVGMKLTNGKVTLTVVFVDHSGVLFDNGYCPNKHEIKAWSLVK